MYNSVIISLDGNIGSGKSTFINIIKEKRPDYHVLDEPVANWEQTTDTDGTNLLEKFYTDQSRWSYTFQNFAYITRLKALKQALSENHKIIITERSIFTDRNIFATMLYEDGKMSELEWKIYNSWFDSFKIDVDGIVYMNTIPDICKDRITTRNRDGEDQIEFSYLNRLHTKHLEVFTNQENVLELTGENDFIKNQNFQDEMLSQVDEYINILFEKKYGKNI